MQGTILQRHLAPALLLALACGSVHAAPMRYTIQRIGLTDSVHTRSDGYQYSLAEQLNALGQVTGYSYRYSGATLLGRDEWFYNGTTTVQLGLAGAAYQRNDGYSESHISQLNDQGLVTGTSRRYSGATDIGRDAWLYDGNSTTRIGFIGAGYERDDGYRSSSPTRLNAQGQVLGSSNRYSGMTALGIDLWFYSGGSTIQLGLTGAGYERSDGFRQSSLAFSSLTPGESFNDQGHVTGNSRRYAGMTDLGRDSWLYNGNSTAQIGLIGAGYERSDGYRDSNVLALNTQGKAVGESKRYSGTTDLGQDAWVYKGNSTVQIGLTGAGYANSNGYRLSEVIDFNNQGQVAGDSRTYSSTGAVGSDAWLYNGSTTVKIGLSGAVYERCGGVSSSGVFNNSTIYSSLNAVGQVNGYTNRCDLAYGYDINGNEGLVPTSRGKDAWVYDGTSTVQVGLTGGRYEWVNPGSINTRETYIVKLNDQGQAVGTSERYLPPYGPYTNDGDHDAWIFDGNSTVLIGFTGAGYERSDGWRQSEVRFLNNRGQAAGWSARASGTKNYGQDAWLYDLETDQTFSLTMFVDPVGNRANSQVAYLGEDGVVLGFSTLYDEITGKALGDRAFYFTVDEGLFDLGLFVDEFTEDGWLSLATAIGINGIGNIIGNGSSVIGNANFPTVPQAAYILTPVTAVPVPAAVWLFASGLGLLGWMKCRQSA